MVAVVQLRVRPRHNTGVNLKTLWGQNGGRMGAKILFSGGYPMKSKNPKNPVKSRLLGSLGILMSNTKNAGDEHLTFG